MSATRYKIKEHQFGPNETIYAVIKMYNHQGMSPKMVEILLKEYGRLNEAEVPRPGTKVKIPIFLGFLGMGDRK